MNDFNLTNEEAGTFELSEEWVSAMPVIDTTKSRNFKLYTGHPLAPEDCLEYNDIAINAEEILDSIRFCGFSYKELKARGASDEAIQLMAERQRIAKQYPDANVELIEDEFGKKVWSIELIRIPKTSGLYEQMKASGIYNYNKLTPNDLEAVMQSLIK